MHKFMNFKGKIVALMSALLLLSNNQIAQIHDAFMKCT